jgi:hypothetical protein
MHFDHWGNSNIPSNSPAEASTSVAHEEVVQQESKKEAMGPNAFKANCFCDVGATGERQLSRVVKEDEDKEKTLMSAPTKKQENSDELLNQWKKGMNMPEDWLDNLEPEDGCHEIIMQIVGEDHSTKLFKIFI